MSYVQQNLMVGEEIIHTAKLHWIIFLKSIFAIVIGVAILIASTEMILLSVIAIALGIVLGIGAFIELTTSEFAITNKRVIVKKGLIRRVSIELLLQKVESVGVDQPILGRILNYGSICLTGTGGSQDPFTTIGNPMEFRKQAQEQIAATIS